MLRRIYAIFQARNREFLRDRAALSWNLILPIALMFGLSFAFGNDRDAYTVGVLQQGTEINQDVHPFLKTKFIHFVAYQDFDLATLKVSRHQIDLLVEFAETPRYWINPESPKGYFAELALLQSTSSGETNIAKQEATGDAVGYADWLLPGILGMNMMFSSLFGVGYVVVRYRKNGFLKRLRATPLTSFEFIAAQVLSRLVLILLITTFIYTGTHLILGTRMEGSYFTLFLVALVGAASLVSLGLVVSARVTSEELAGGLLNLINWPMMMLSGVWFSLEGAPDVVRSIANIFPLTHVLNAARAVMLDGATLIDVGPSLLALTAMSAVFFAVGAKVFRWGQY
ncbi:MAG: ABC transporter permease [Gammaproteobacteria bacterium]|nr:ABC transporter permease [Gammaproteobacteria bacterium]MDH5241596.1 ABC transporter permease [Gammaproteobacteria bacterium]MDH5260990.1 ABC transporter permease [Gammaproteobacteria bacterium]MDH5582349.1 ABC transporter permease [Gammaproteobacteria bacterium]